jgi:hypothetical protein
MPISSGAQSTSSVAEQVRPNMLAEGVFGPLFDLLPDGRAAHRPAVAIEPEVPSDTALSLPLCS